MASMLGMDPDQVESMGHQMQKQADNISSSIIPIIDNLVNQIPTVWNGSDANQFKQWWTGQHRGQLVSAAGDLKGLGQSALNNAREQRNTSGH